MPVLRLHDAQGVLMQPGSLMGITAPFGEGARDFTIDTLQALSVPNQAGQDSPGILATRDRPQTGERAQARIDNSGDKCQRHTPRVLSPPQSW